MSTTAALLSKPQNPSGLKGSRYKFSSHVLNFAKREGIERGDLIEMVRRAARVTHDMGNRRFHQYVFLQIGDDVLSMSLLPQSSCSCENADNRELKPNEFIVYEDCPQCGRQIKIIRRNPEFHHSTEGVNERRIVSAKPYRY